MGGKMRRLVKWLVCRAARTAEMAEDHRRQASEIEHLKARAARQTDPGKVKSAAAERLAKLVGASLLFACHDLTPRQQEQLGLFECRVAAVAPLIGAIIEPAEFVRDVTMGKVDPVRALMTAGATVSEISAVAAAWRACETEPEPAQLPAQLTPNSDRS